MHAEIERGEELDLTRVPQRPCRRKKLHRRTESDNCCQASEISHGNRGAQPALDSTDLALRPAEPDRHLLLRCAGGMASQSKLTAQLESYPDDVSIGLGEALGARRHRPMMLSGAYRQVTGRLPGL